MNLGDFLIDFESELHQRLDEKWQEMLDKYRQLGLKATGNWEDIGGPETENQGFSISGRIIVAHYTVQLSEGRKPGKFPGKNWKENIGDWVDAKNNIPQGMTRNQWIFLVARKIAIEGTEIYKRGGTELISATITPEWIEEMKELFKDFMSAKINENLVEKLRGVMAA